MPKQTEKDRHKTKSLGVRLEKSLVDQFRALAKANRRTLTAEMAIALERHLKAQEPKE